MLQKIRDNTKGTAARIFVGFIAAVFGLWGVQYLVGSFTGEVPAITVNGVEISETEVQAETNRRAQELIASMGENADFSQIDDSLIRETAIDSLIQQQLLFQHAVDSGLAITPSAIDRQIRSIPEFQVDGAFNNTRAQTMLANAGYTPQTFRSALARERLLNQLLVVYSESGFITPAELEKIAALSDQTRDFRYMLINFQDQAGEVEITDDQVQSYYDNNSQQFMREEQVAINYIVLDKNALAEEVEISDQQIQSQYQQELTAFQSEVERRASHILLEASSPEDVSAAVAEAEQIKQRLDNGEDFADLALEFSDDLGSAEDGGDVGYTNGDSFVEGFETALQSLEVDEVSDPVITEFGVHLIKLTEMSSSEFETLEEASERIRNELSRAEADLRYLEEAEQLGNLSFESVDLQDPAEIMNLQIQSSDLFGRSGGIGVTANPQVIEAAFSLEVLDDRLNSELIRLDDNRSIVIHVTEHNPPAIRDLSEVRPEIEILLRDQAVRERAMETGERILDSLRNGQNLSTLLETQGLSWNEVSGVGRDNSDLNPQLIDEVFSMEKPAESGSTLKGFSMMSGDYAVVELQQVIAGSLEDMEENQANSLTAFVSQQSGTFDFNAMLSSLESKAEIER